MKELFGFNIVANEVYGKDFNELGPVEQNIVITLIINN